MLLSLLCAELLRRTHSSCTQCCVGQSCCCMAAQQIRSFSSCCMKHVRNTQLHVQKAASYSSSSSKGMAHMQQTLLSKQLAAVTPQGLDLHWGIEAAAALAVPAHPPAGVLRGGQSLAHGH
jgi:hypothetical protein